MSSGYLSDVSRGRRNMGVKVQRRVEALLQAPAQAAPAQNGPRSIDPRALWERMDAHCISQNEVARRAGISVGYLSGDHERPAHSRRADVLRRLHDVLFATLSSGTGDAGGVEGAWPGRRAGATAMVLKGAGGPRSNGKDGDSEPSGSAAGRPGGRRCSSPTPPATTATDGCSSTTWCGSQAAPPYAGETAH